MPTMTDPNASIANTGATSAWIIERPAAREMTNSLDRASERKNQSAANIVISGKI